MITQPCPGLVDEIEAMNLDGQKLRSLLTRYLAPMLDAQADTIVLGCTHYSFIAPLIQEIAGENVRLIDTGAPVAVELFRRLNKQNLLHLEKVQTPPQFYTSAVPARMEEIFAQFWGEKATIQPLPSQCPE